MAFLGQWTCATWPISPLAKGDACDLRAFNARAKRGLFRLVLPLVEPILAPRHRAGGKKRLSDSYGRTSNHRLPA